MSNPLWLGGRPASKQSTPLSFTPANSRCTITSTAPPKAMQESRVGPATAPGAQMDDHGNEDESGNDANKPAARKDRACPFCRQQFTSSSLGRHLDLYIKEKNPKAPDGLHDVDQIRKMRRGITRRHARASGTGSMKKDNNKRETSTSSPMPDAPSTMSSPAIGMQSPGVNSVSVPRAQPPLNRLNWQATGVINDLPPRTNGFAQARDASAHDSLRTTHEQRQRELEERDNGHAAELALRELLQTLHAARARIEHEQMFPFDALSLDFPALVLQVLPSPPTLFSTTPSPTSESWPVLRPPNAATRTSVSTAILTRFAPHLPAPLTNLPPRALADALPSTRPPPHDLDLCTADLIRHLDHLNSTYAHWSSLAPAAQLDAWSLALLRHAAATSTRATDAEKALARVQLELDHLRAQFDTLKAAGLHGPGLALSHPLGTTPARLPASLSPETTRELSTSAAADIGAGGWEAEQERLLSRWRALIRAGKGITAGQARLWQASMVPLLPVPKNSVVRNENQRASAGASFTAEEARGLRSGRVNEEDDGEGDVDMDEEGAR